MSMEILKFDPVKVESCQVYLIHLRIDDLKATAGDMIKRISDTSWLEKLDYVPKTTFTATSKKTIDKLVNQIYAKIDTKVTKEFGEYLISDASQLALRDRLEHTIVPLAELLKEKISWNHWFDFHTEWKSENWILSFGEAKYRSSWNPHEKAMTQVMDFIKDGKDDADLLILQSFVTQASIDNFKFNRKAFAAAFSINWKDIDWIFGNALKHSRIKELITYPELYLIGVEIWK